MAGWAAAIFEDMNRKQRRAQARQPPVLPRPTAPEIGALFDDAVRQFERGRLPDAERRLRQVLAQAPGHAPALHMLGLTAHRAGDDQTAVRLIGAAISSRPDDAEAHYNLGACLGELGRLDAALEAFDAAVRLRPGMPRAHAGRGGVLRALGRPDAALAAFDAAVRLAPSFAAAHANRGACLNDLGRFEEALGACDAALRLDPEIAEAHANRGAALKDLGRPAEALAACDAALRLRPGNAGALANRGACLKDLGRPDEALAACEAALRLDPSLAAAHANLGACLGDLGRFEEALAAADRALALNPALVDAHANRATALDDLGRLREALEAHDRALALDPRSARTHHGRALTLLRAGDLATGFAEYRWRWRVGDMARKRPPLTCPEWEGEPLTGKRLLVFAEQGFGDTLQFVRYVPMAAALGADVTVLVDRPVRRLIADSLPHVLVVDSLPEGAAFDAQIAMLCLPRLFRTTLETIPAAAPYLAADAERTARWAARLGTLRGRKVGLAWAGAARRHDPRASMLDARRSLRLAQFAPLASAPDVQFVSLQVGDAAAQAGAPPAGMRLVDWAPELRDFADTAALVAALDLVVTVDTAVAHLAGGLGRPVWILSRYDGCWRWLKDRQTSPWYPTARLFHQPAPGEWDPAVGAVAAALTAG
ncbi:MAG TPA: tetratricopeptide repeat protein [Caulobacteraceae bacterium]|jgi:tetratricopeptide (TPR) repeat protein|nr:tetratricopeptide repeat protein [Caulobacteraceae bacterium]